MTGLLYILLGWLLGLIGSRIIDVIKAKYEKQKLFIAIKSEMEELQYRLAIASFLIIKHQGKLSQEYLIWLKPKLVQYKGNEPVESTIKLVEAILSSPEDQLMALALNLQAKKGTGLNLKKFTSGLIESSLGILPSFPVEYQRRIHQFRNRLYALNQEIEIAIETHRMTFDSSISADNYSHLTNNLENNYEMIQSMCKHLADIIQHIIDYKLYKYKYLW